MSAKIFRGACKAIIAAAVLEIFLGVILAVAMDDLLASVIATSGGLIALMQTSRKMREYSSDKDVPA